MDHKKPQKNIAIVTALLITSAIAAAALILIRVSPAFSQQSQDQANTPKVTPERAAMEVSRRCASCHAIKPGVKTFAPPLVGVLGRKAGSYKGFSFSKKIKELDLTWTNAALNDFLAGKLYKDNDTGKSHVGIAQPELRKAVVEYIATLREQAP